MQFPDWLRPFFGRMTWRKDADSRTIYLTFDDGPVPEVTPQVLDLLDEFGWKATFFCVGDNVMKYPELYRQVLDRGHRVGNHSFHHLKGFRYSTEEYVQNVEKAAEYIESNLFRPPYGRIKAAQAKALQQQYEIIMWDVLTYDYDRSKSPTQIMNIILRKSRNGSIVVMHDSVKARKNVLTVLPMAMAYWKAQGYECGLL